MYTEDRETYYTLDLSDLTYEQVPHILPEVFHNSYYQSLYTYSSIIYLTATRGDQPKRLLADSCSYPLHSAVVLCI